MWQNNKCYYWYLLYPLEKYAMGDKNRNAIYLQCRWKQYITHYSKTTNKSELHIRTK